MPDPAYQTTRAITIRAPAADVWPWLVQIGYQRGGFYSYDWLEPTHFFMERKMLLGIKTRAESN